MFNKRNKRKIKNVAILDLRHYSEAALKHINIIKNVALLVLPEQNDKDCSEALGSIQMKNVANTIYLKKDDIICSINGSGIIYGEQNTENKVYVVNGCGMVINAKDCAPVRIITNGLLIYEKGSNVDLLNTNGRSIASDYSLEGAKIFSADLLADALFIDNLREGSTVFCGNTLTISADVTLEILKEKNIHFYAGNSIICNSQDVFGFAKANYYAGNNIKLA